MVDHSREIVDRASRGETYAIEALLQENASRLYAFVRLRCGPLIRGRESSSDIVQSVCREVLAGMGNLEYRGAAQFRAWLYTAAARKIADRVEYYRAERRAPDREISMDARDGGDSDLTELSSAYANVMTPSRALDSREAIGRIERAFARLSDEKREVILLARVAGLTSAEIAEREGETDVAVRARLRRALAELAVLLDLQKEG